MLTRSMFTTAALLAAAVAALPTPAMAVTTKTKNIILMISDGQGYNTVKAADYYTGAPAVYESFAHQYGMSTYSATGLANTPAGAKPGYDPARFWSSFSYQSAPGTATDSASAASAMYTGVKIKDNVINIATDNTTKLTTITQFAEAQGKATGAVSTVQFYHATPAAVGAHNISRNNYGAISTEMIYNSDMEVIIGAGHPLYNDNGQLKAGGISYSAVGGTTVWNDITDADGANGFKFIDSKAGFQAIADGSAAAPDKLLGITQVASTNQQARSGNGQIVDFASFNANIPDLATMSEAALNVLSKDQDGFFVMVEGGAIDWANHANQKGRMIEEQIDFNNAVQAVIDWVNNPLDANDWSNTLLLVTADHETGALWGPLPGQFNDVVDNGAGNMPGMAFNSGNHTNALVPLYAMGEGAADFMTYAVNSDPVRGLYVDNTDLFHVMKNGLSPIPEPATAGLAAMGLASLAFASRRRRHA